ncbi:uncharacterized protein BP01DRAFT_200099 [Aspergillus saccharolyticus JOP 1030-1]|uniref:Uncharacterized protein n=1 Tax=Aspergillus saccharolyticus JOP 1030-1 TaxID=1450539 RepID=A0A318ZMJ9_9EURO|nr:hypothetical protein BP01DRAFT_200099 [Aspergillus saccharolyticus JOP 1030-1]PYH47905.1 hypothetical protein BP01DRAFT_200099 [Aspergillus saccharolyticus JOP 1030-1]
MALPFLLGPISHTATSLFSSNALTTSVSLEEQSSLFDRTSAAAENITLGLRLFTPLIANRQSCYCPQTQSCIGKSSAFSSEIPCSFKSYKQ